MFVLRIGFPIQVGERGMRGAVSGHAGSAAGSDLSYRPMVPALEAEVSVFAVIDVGLDSVGRDNLERLPLGLQIDKLNVWIGRPGNSRWSIRPRKSSGGLGIPVVSLGLALHISQRDRIPVDIVFRPAPWLVQHDSFLPFVGYGYIRGMKHLLPYRNAVRINGPVFIRPITPAGIRTWPGDLVVLNF